MNYAPYNSNMGMGIGMNMNNFQSQPPQMRTNKIFVTSLEDALNRYAEPNTIIVYRHQDEKFEYEIMTDSQGKKTYKTLQLAEYSTVGEDKGAGVSTIPTERLNALESRLSALESEVLKKSKKQEEH